LLVLARIAWTYVVKFEPYLRAASEAVNLAQIGDDWVRDGKPLAMKFVAAIPRMLLEAIVWAPDWWKRKSKTMQAITRRRTGCAVVDFNAYNFLIYKLSFFRQNWQFQDDLVATTRNSEW